MKVTKNTLTSIQNEDKFKHQFILYADDTLKEAHLKPQFSHPRLSDAWGAWMNDLERVGAHERKLSDGLDHFKQAGHLAFWLRRMSPVTEAYDLLQNRPESEIKETLGEKGEQFRELLFAYFNEYLAFDYAYQLCRYYELAQDPPSTRANELRLSKDYLKLTCNFMKYKTVSPHAMMLVYKSLLLPDGSYDGPAVYPGAA